MHIAKPEEIHLVGLVGFGGQRVPEKEHQIDFIAADAGGDLLISAVGAAEKALNCKAGGIGDQLSGGTGGAKAMTA